MADQMRRAGAHCRDVQRMRDLPDQPRVMGGRGAARQQAEKVSPLDRRKPCVPFGADLGAGADRHARAFEVVVQRLAQAEGVPALAQIAMRDLRGGMDPGVRATGGGDGMGAGFKPCQRLFDRALNRGLIGLTLPPGKGRAVIFDLKGITGHVGDLSRAGRRVQCRVSAGARTTA